MFDNPKKELERLQEQLLAVEGAAQLVGPDVVTAEGGMCGTYVRTTGEAGTAKLTVSAHGIEPVTVEFTVQ